MEPRHQQVVIYNGEFLHHSLYLIECIGKEPQRKVWAHSREGHYGTWEKGEGHTNCNWDYYQPTAMSVEQFEFFWNLAKATKLGRDASHYVSV